MKSKPIIFSTDSMRAILDGRKTMTRRVLGEKEWLDKQWGLDREPYLRDGRWLYDKQTAVDGSHTYELKPRYAPGDILWVRETWESFKVKRPIRAIPNDFKDVQYIYRADGICVSGCSEIKWRSPMYMPKAATRLFLRVTDVRVERLQDISEEDALAEGISTCDDGCFGDNGWSPTYNDPDSGGEPIFRNGFLMRWDRINGKRDGGAYAWDKNPWVWAISFERIEKPEGVEI
jgi:hypothetical protein